jgi:hypothetical protein
MINTSGMKKTNSPGYYKDPKTGFIHNTNEDQLRAYLHGRKNITEFNDLKINYARLESELDQIKKALGIK